MAPLSFRLKGFAAPVDGIICFNKPIGISSAKALYRVRSITHQRKSGHAGTLDPGASGVLVLCLGRATKLVERIMDQPKVYRSIARLDVTSESFDSDRPLIPVEIGQIPSLEDVIARCEEFQGRIQQVPPAISAVKVRGQAAYKRVRQNETFVLAPRPVQIYWLVVHRYAWPELEFELGCGRGTYVRSLIRDLGERLGVGGCLTSLVRSRVGPFSLDNAWSFESLEGAAQPDDYLVDLERARTILEPGAIEIPARPQTYPEASA